MKNVLSFLKSNYSNLCIALVLAVITWFFVDNELSDEKTMPGIAVRIALPPNSGLRVVEVQNDQDIPGAPIDGLTVTFTGPKSSIRKLEYQNITFRHVIAFDGKSGSSFEYSIAPDESEFTGLPKRVEVSEIYPSRIRVILDKESSKQLTVRTSDAAVGDMRGRTVKIANPRPPMIKVFGPERLLNANSEIAISAIDVSNVDASLYDVSAYIEHTIGGVEVTPDDEIIKVDIIVEEQYETLPVRGLKIDVLYPEKFDYEVELVKNEIAIELVGPKNAIEGLRNQQPSTFIKVFADVPLLLTQSGASIKENTPHQCPLKFALYGPSSLVSLKEKDLGSVNVIFRRKK